MAGITMTGMSGIDVGSLISQLVALKQQEVTRVTDRKTVANKQVDAYTKLSSYLSEFSTKAAAINKTTSFNVYKTTSKSEAIGVTTTGAAQAGNYSIQVHQLAQKEKLTSSAGKVTDTEKSLASMGIAPGKFSVNGVEIELIDTDTINDLRMKINNSNTKASTKAEFSDSDVKLATAVPTTVKEGEYEYKKEDDGSYSIRLKGKDGEADGAWIKGTEGLGGRVTFNSGAANGLSITIGENANDTGTITVSKEEAKKVGVTATVVRAGEGDFRLVFTSDESGEKGIEYKDLDGGNVLQSLGFITDADGTKNGANVLMKGQDALFSVDNIEMSSSTNTVNDRIAGVNLELKKVTGDEGPVEVNVSRDDDAITKKVEDLVNMYNSLLKFTNEQTSYTPGETDKDGNQKDPVKGALFGDSTIKTVTANIRALFQNTFTVNGEQISLSSIGIETDYKTGNFTLNKEKFQEALTNDFDKIVGIFVTNGSTDSTTVQYGRSTADTQQGDYEIRETMVDGKNTFQIRLKGANSDPDAGWVNGIRSGSIVTFKEGPANGMSITAPEGSADGKIVNLTLSKGFAGAVEDKIKQLTDFEKGVVAQKKESINSKIRNIDAEVIRVQKRVDAYQLRLTNQFAAMENTMMMLKNQQSSLFAQLGIA